MARVAGKKYSSKTLSDYKTQEEAERYMLMNYPLPAVEIVTQDSDYVFYFEDSSGQVYTPATGHLPGGNDEGLLIDENRDKRSAFSARILEIEGLEELTVEQAFELSDASAERSAAGCTIKLSKKSITE